MDTHTMRHPTTDCRCMPCHSAVSSARRALRIVQRAPDTWPVQLASVPPRPQTRSTGPPNPDGSDSPCSPLHIRTLHKLHARPIGPQHASCSLTYSPISSSEPRHRRRAPALLASVVAHVRGAATTRRAARTLSAFCRCALRQRRHRRRLATAPRRAASA
jgi:hypothetical protein